MCIRYVNGRVGYMLKGGWGISTSWCITGRCKREKCVVCGAKSVWYGV